MNLTGIAQPLHHVWTDAGRLGHHVADLAYRVFHPASGTDYMAEAFAKAGDQLVGKQEKRPTGQEPTNQKPTGQERKMHFSWFME